MIDDTRKLGPRLDGSVFAVTGTSSGIGLAAARMLAALGAEVIGVDRNPGVGGVAGHIRADLSDPAEIDRVADALPAGLHGLANVAGVPPTEPPATVLRVNFLAVKRLTLTLIPKLSDGASIVNVISLAGNRWAQSVDAIRAADEVTMEDPEPFLDRFGITGEDGRSYFFSKEALVAWTLRNRWSWRDRGIRMNAVSPGPVDTPIYPDFERSLGVRARTAAEVMDRLGRPEDIAPVIAFLLSDMSVWLRGAVIPADGGMAAHYLCQQHGL